MSINKRHRNRWTINETLSLQREYELLEWNVYDIAEKHQRTVMAIMSKLQKEEIIGSWNEARGFNLEEYEEDSHDLQTTTNYEDINVNEEEYTEDDEDYNILYLYDDEDYTDYTQYESQEAEIENNVKRIMDRVWSLQTSISEIGSIIKQVFTIFLSNPKEEQHEETN